MPIMKKRSKNSRHRGSHTHSRGAKKKARGKGHRGGIGMAGTGKRADHRKATALQIKGYFGTTIALRRGKAKVKLLPMNLGDIMENGDFSKYKILASGEAMKGLKIKAGAASAKAIEKIKAAGGSIELPEPKVKKEVKKEATESKEDKE